LDFSPLSRHPLFFKHGSPSPSFPFPDQSAPADGPERVICVWVFFARCCEMLSHPDTLKQVSLPLPRPVPLPCPLPKPADLFVYRVCRRRFVFSQAYCPPFYLSMFPTPFFFPCIVKGGSELEDHAETLMDLTPLLFDRCPLQDLFCARSLGRSHPFLSPLLSKSSLIEPLIRTFWARPLRRHFDAVRRPRVLFFMYFLLPDDIASCSTLVLPPPAC